MNARLPEPLPRLAEADFAEIAAALGIKKQSARMRAKREGWKFRTRSVMGGQQHAFSLADLPKKTARKVAARRAVVALRQVEHDTGEFTLIVDGEVFLVKRLGGTT